MSTTVFPFAVSAPYAEGLAYPMVVTEAENGRDVRRLVGSTTKPRFVVRQATLVFPNQADQSFKDWIDFYRARQGGIDTFLFKAQAPALFYLSESRGTSTGAAGETFTTTRKFLNADTLVVKVGDVVQTLTTDYTFSGNNTAPTVTTTNQFDAGTVTLEYEYYYQVYLSSDPYDPDYVSGGRSLAAPGIQRVVVSMSEAIAGGAEV